MIENSQRGVKAIRWVFSRSQRAPVASEMRQVGVPASAGLNALAGGTA